MEHDIEKLLNSQYPMIRAYSWSLTRDNEAAKEVFQETALRACRSFENFKEGTSFKAWILTLTRNAHIDIERKRARMRRVINPLEEANQQILSNIKSEGPPDLTFEGKELESLIEELTFSLGHPLKLRMQGYSYQEISTLMGVSIGTIKSRIFFAKKNLIKKIN